MSLDIDNSNDPAELEDSNDQNIDNKLEGLPQSNNYEVNAQTSEKVLRNEVLRKLKLASYICFAFFLVEVTGGLLAGSLAVLSDAVHLGADLSAFVLAIVGSHIAGRPASESHTFGFRRAESLAALLSMVFLLILSIGLAGEAILRICELSFSQEDVTLVDGKLMSTIAAIGVVVNVILAFVLGEDHVHMPGADHGHCHDHDHGDHHDHNGHSDFQLDHVEEHGIQLCLPCREDRSVHNCRHHDHDGHSHSHHEHDEENIANTTFDAAHVHGAKCKTNKKRRKRVAYVSVPGMNDAQNGDEFIDNVSQNHASECGSKKKGRNVNLHAAYIHVMADLAQSVVVLIAGLIIWKNPTWQLTDPICTLIFSVMVCYSTVGVIRSSLSVLLEEVPPGVDWGGMYDAISSVEGVSNVHDLHIWSISHGHSILSVHGVAKNVEQAYRDIKNICNQRNISHVTVQLQPRTIDGCLTCSEESVHLCR